MGNSQKIPFVQSLNQAATKRALDTIQILGKALPCSVVSVSNSIVTVKFELQHVPYTLPNVTMPMFGPEYIRYPIQVGCKGVAFPADCSLRDMSGLGSGVADLSKVANLAALVFFPIGNKGWTPTDDPNAVVIYGPDGVVLRDIGKTAIVTVVPNSITGTAQTITLNGNVIINGSITVNP